jgi:hypothetical protein
LCVLAFVDVDTGAADENPRSIGAWHPRQRVDEGGGRHQSTVDQIAHSTGRPRPSTDRRSGEIDYSVSRSENLCPAARIVPRVPALDRYAFAARPLLRRRMAAEDDRFVAAGLKGRGNPATDETAPAGNDDSHLTEKHATCMY